MSLTKSRIEWTDYTLNPVKGMCPVDCNDSQGKYYCYARRMYKRFKWNPEIRYIGHVNLGNKLNRITKPSKIFVGSTMELFGDWIKPEWMEAILHACKLWGEKYGHTFIFLTKQPQNLIKWSPFPENCWVGVSVTNEFVIARDMIFTKMSDIDAKVKFISFEPLQSKILEPYLLDVGLRIAGISWLILGQQTPVRMSTMPKMEWIQDILVAAHNANIPVFTKNNLQSLLTGEWSGWKLHQEFPRGQ